MSPEYCLFSLPEPKAHNDLLWSLAANRDMFAHGSWTFYFSIKTEIYEITWWCSTFRVVVYLSNKQRTWRTILYISVLFEKKSPVLPPLGPPVHPLLQKTCPETQGQFSLNMFLTIYSLVCWSSYYLSMSFVLPWLYCVIIPGGILKKKKNVLEALLNTLEYSYF